MKYYQVLWHFPLHQGHPCSTQYSWHRSCPHLPSLLRCSRSHGGLRRKMDLISRGFSEASCDLGKNSCLGLSIGNGGSIDGEIDGKCEHDLLFAVRREAQAFFFLDNSQDTAEQHNCSADATIVQCCYLQVIGLFFLRNHSGIGKCNA